MNDILHVLSLAGRSSSGPEVGSHAGSSEIAQALAVGLCLPKDIPGVGCPNPRSWYGHLILLAASLFQ